MSKVLLGDVVDRIKDKVDKDNTNIEYYIGGEHFDNGAVTIDKKGIIAGSTIGPAFHMRFQPGDVLLMSRNPQLRKAGMVNFEGICSDVSYVCRTRDENILLQNFLPFIFQSDSFWTFAEKNKKGSTNFFLNWSDFEKYEFDLPDIETQMDLCKILWPINETRRSYIELRHQTDELIKAQFVEMFGDPNGSPMFPRKPLGELTICFDSSRKPVNSGERKKIQGPYPYYGATGVVDHLNDYKLDGKYLLISEDGKALEFRNYDISFIVTGKIWVNNHAHVLQCKDDLDMVYLNYYIKYLDISNWVTGIDQKKLNRENMDAIPVVLPSIDKQKAFSEFVYQADKSKSELNYAIENLDSMYKKILKNNLG